MVRTFLPKGKNLLIAPCCLLAGFAAAGSQMRDVLSEYLFSRSDALATRAYDLNWHSNIGVKTLGNLVSGERFGGSRRCSAWALEPWHNMWTNLRSWSTLLLVMKRIAQFIYEGKKAMFL